LSAAAVAFSLTLGTGTAMAADNVRITLVVKALGIGFFEAARKGGEEAAKELGNVELIYTGPTTTEGQTETLNELIAQRVNAIAVTVNDTSTWRCSIFHVS
jgi:rhamnose transport system substrate-binding protein